MTGAVRIRLLVMLQHGDCHPSNVSIPLQISSFMYEDDYSLLIGFTLAKRTKKRIRINCICYWKMSRLGAMTGAVRIRLLVVTINMETVTLPMSVSRYKLALYVFR